MFVFSSLDFYFRLTKCKLWEKKEQNPNTLVLALALSTNLIETLLFSYSSVDFYVFTEKIYGREMEN